MAPKETEALVDEFEALYANIYIDPCYSVRDMERLNEVASTLTQRGVDLDPLRDSVSATAVA